MKKVLKLLGSLCLVVMFTGCTTRLIDFTMISTKNMDLSRAATFRRGPTRAEGIDSCSIIIFIPTGTPNIKEAIDRAIETVPGAVALVDGVVSYKSWYIPYIFGKAMYIVEGTPLIDPQLAGTSLTSNYIISEIEKNGQVAKTRYVSREEYASIRKAVIK